MSEKKNNNEILQTDILLDRSGILIEKDKRGLVCYFSYTPSNAMPKLTLSVVKATLKKAGVVHGILLDDLRELEDRDEPIRNFVVARGKRPVMASAMRLKYRFPVNPYGQIKRAGKREQINYRDRGQLPYVKRGDVVADIVAEGETSPGLSITGEEISPEDYESADIEPGPNVSMIRNQLIAQIDGAPRLNKDGKVEIFQEWVVDGDVDIHTGNIIFPGPVNIKGDIQPGFLVQAESVRCRGIENKTQIETKGDLSVSGGALGGKIHCGGKLTVKFINNATVMCGGDVEASVSIINTDLNSAGKVTTQTIFGGSITAKNGVDCLNLSSEANRSTVIIGVDPINQENISSIIREKIDIEGQIHYLSEKAGDNLKFYENYLKAREDIKPYLPERESIKARLEAMGDDEDENKEFFVARMKEIDEIVEPLQEELKSGKARFEEVRQKYMNEIMQMERLKKRLADLEQQQAALHVESKSTDVLIPKLNVKGKALMGTKISSTHARMVLKRDYNRVVFFQRKVHDSEKKKYGNLKYIMVVDRM